MLTPLNGNITGSTERLRKLRMLAGVSLRAIPAATEVPFVSVSRWEHGAQHLPNTQIRAIADTVRRAARARLTEIKALLEADAAATPHRAADGLLIRKKPHNLRLGVVPVERGTRNMRTHRH